MSYFTIGCLIALFISVILVLLWILFYKFKYIVRLEYENSRVLYSIYVAFLNFEIKIIDGDYYPFAKKNEEENSVIQNLTKRLFNDVSLCNRITYRDITLKVVAGCEDVIITSLGYGVLSTIFSIVPIVLKKVLSVKNFSIKLVPVFKQNKLQVSLKCIVRIKSADIIIILFSDNLRRWWNKCRIQLTS